MTKERGKAYLAIAALDAAKWLIWSIGITLTAGGIAVIAALVS